MENETAFDLNERLHQWRSTLKNRSAIREGDIEELESHLIDTMDALSQSGLSPEEAFLVGAHRVGHPLALDDQFGRVKPGAVWKERAQWMVLGILSLWMASGLAKVVTSLTLWFGGQFAGNGFALGWASLAVQTFLILCFGWLAFGMITRDGNNAPTSRPNPVLPLAARWIIYLSVGTIVLGISGTFLQVIAIRATGPSLLGMYLAVTQWGTAVFMPAIVIAAGLWLASSSKLKSAGGITILLFTGLAVGCSPSGGSADRSVSSSRAASFENCLELIHHDMNAAVDAFLEMDLTQGELFSPGSALSYSESEFVKLPASAREKLGQQAIADVELVKRLAMEVRSRRNGARVAGDTPLAERCNAQLAKLGERLTGPANLKLTQVVGKAVCYSSCSLADCTQRKAQPRRSFTFGNLVMLRSALYPTSRTSFH